MNKVVYSVEKVSVIPIRRANSKHDFSNIEVGSCAFFPGLNYKSKGVQALLQYGYRHGWKVVARTSPDGIRLWRTAEGV